MSDEVCPYTKDGQHLYYPNRWRIPVSSLVYYSVSAPPNLLEPLRYWEIEGCQLCEYEKYTPHGFTPKTRRDGTNIR